MGTTKKVVVSKGIEESTVPDLKGKSQEDAIKLLEDANLKYQIVEEESKKIEAGYVISQETDANKKVNAGDTVIIHVSTGVKKSSVPSVIGKSEDEAKKSLTDLGLKVTVANDEDSSKENGVVLKQSVDAGKEVEQGSSITITVNKKKEIKATTLEIDIKSLMDEMGKQIEYIDNSSNSKNEMNETSSSGNNKEMKKVKLEVIVDGDSIVEDNVEPTEKKWCPIKSTNEIVKVKIRIDGVLAKQPYIEINLNNADSITKIQ